MRKRLHVRRNEKRRFPRSAGACPPRGFNEPFFRSAGACPPRSIHRNKKRPSLQRFRRFLSHPLHGEGQALALRGRKSECHRPTVARGPVPRDLSTGKKTSESPGIQTFSLSSDAWRGTGPRPTWEVGALPIVLEFFSDSFSMLGTRGPTRAPCHPHCH